MPTSDGNGRGPHRHWSTLNRFTLQKGISRPLAAIVASVTLFSQPVAAGKATDAMQTTEAPAAPTLTASFRGKALHLTWTALTGAHYYRLLQRPAGAPSFVQVADQLTTTSHDRDVGAHRPNWSATRYLLEACNTVGCTASNEITTLDAVLGAIGFGSASTTVLNYNQSVPLALSEDGNTLVVGAPEESSAATGVNGNPVVSPGAASSGAVYVFARRDGIWSRQAYVKASNTSAGDSFGSSVSVSHDGNTLAVGAYLEDGTGVGVNRDSGSVADNNSNSGAVYVFTRNHGQWSQQAYIKASNTRTNAYFGHAVSLNGNGNVLAIGAIGENGGGLNAGAVYVFSRGAGSWSQQAYVKASKVRTNAYFGSSVILSTDGRALEVEAPGDAAISGNDAGVYVFTRSAGVWLQQSFVHRSDTARVDTLRPVIDLTLEDQR